MADSKFSSYTIPNSILVDQLNLIKHPEGGPCPILHPVHNLCSFTYNHATTGYYAETDRQSEQIPSPFVGMWDRSCIGSPRSPQTPDGASRSLATTIYYLLTPDEPNGVFHMNKSATMHVLHQGRAEYTLITPGSPPRIERKVIGPNIHAGEVLQLLVPSGVWKMSRILPADLVKADPERIGCLITEVVFPGFAWEDHGFLTQADLEALFAGTPGVEEWVPYVRKA